MSLSGRVLASDAGICPKGCWQLPNWSSYDRGSLHQAEERLVHHRLRLRCRAANMSPTVPVGTVTRLRSFAGAMRHMSLLTHVVLRRRSSSGAQAITQEVPTLRVHLSVRGRAESGCASAEPASRLRAKLLVFGRSGRLRDAVPALSSADGPPAAHRVRPIPAGTPQRATLQRVRWADDGRTARRAPDVRPKDGLVMTPRSTVAARPTHREVYEHECRRCDPANR